MPASSSHKNHVIILIAIAVASLGLLMVIWLGLDLAAAYFAAPFLSIFPRASFVVPLFIIFGGYLVLRKWSGLAGVALGVTLVWLLSIGIPARVNPGIIAQDRALLARDMSPGQPIELSGVVGIVRSPGRYDAPKPLACDELCLSLLYSGKVSGVVMGKAKESTADQARLWTVIKGRTACTVETNAGESAIWDNQLNPAAAKLRGLLGECLRSQPSDMALADFIIEGEVIGDPAIPEDTRLLNPPVSGTRLSLWSRGAKGLILVARDTRLKQRQLLSPLHFTTGGGAFSGPYAVLARVRIEGLTQPDIGHFINLAGVKIEEPSPAELRARLDDWLNDAGERDPKVTTALRSAVLGLMRGTTVEPGDLARYRRLILDRDGDQFVVEPAIRQFPEAAPMLLDAAITRIGSLPRTSDKQAGIASALTKFPPGTFAEPSPQLLKLLHDPERAERMAEMFGRLAEDNPNAAPLMMSLLIENFPSESKPRSEGSRGTAAFAALHQLCRIGTPAARYLPEVERLVAGDREMSFRLDGSLGWAITRLRLGKPRAEIDTPDEQAEEWEELLKHPVTKSDCIK